MAVVENTKMAATSANNIDLFISPIPPGETKAPDLTIAKLLNPAQRLRRCACDSRNVSRNRDGIREISRLSREAQDPSHDPSLCCGVRPGFIQRKQHQEDHCGSAKDQSRHQRVNLQHVEHDSDLLIVE